MYTKNFKQLSKNDVGIAGGKGASLGEMTKAKILVPPGFVILVEAFDRFMAETDLSAEIIGIIKNINYKDLNSVDAASNKIRDLIYDVPMPKDLENNFLAEFKKLKTPLVAVRSSATAEDSSVASWAGELETYLNTTEKNLIDNIKKCWSSLFTPRALFYAFEKKVFTKKHQEKIRALTSKNLKDAYPVSVAVVVQKMVQSEIAGITFTAHPVTRDRNQMVIEAAYGLGELIVSGQVTPDTYIVGKSQYPNNKLQIKSKIQNPKSDFSIVDINTSEQKEMLVRGGAGIKRVSVPKNKQERQKLTGAQIIKLAELCQKIEEHYKFPQDIEWALEKGKFYITQSRPITTL
jgi:pyruvate,water dikinase